MIANEKKLYEKHLDHVNLNINCILVILHSKYTPIEILLQSEYITLELIFFLTTKKQVKCFFFKCSTYVEMISDLIIKGKLRLCQLPGIDIAEIIVPFINDAINKLYEESNSWQKSCSIFFEAINSNYPNSERF